MATTVAWTTEDQLLAGGAAFTQYAVRVFGEGGGPVLTQLVPFGTTSAEFELAAGTYTAGAHLANADGTMLGDGATSDPFIVPEPGVTRAVPTTVTVTVPPAGTRGRRR